MITYLIPTNIGKTKVSNRVGLKILFWLLRLGINSLIDTCLYREQRQQGGVFNVSNGPALQAMEMRIKNEASSFPCSPQLSISSCLNRT